MNAIAWTAAAIRLMALWLVVGVLVGLPGFVANWFSRSDFGEQAEFVAASLRANLTAELATLATAALLWFKSVTLARWIWQEPVTPETSHTVTAVDLQRAVFVGVGIYLVVYGLPNLVELAAGHYSLPAGFQMEQHFSGQMNARAIGVAIQIVVGLGLILGSQGISNLVGRARTMRRGVDADDVDEE